MLYSFDLSDDVGAANVTSLFDLQFWTVEIYCDAVSDSFLRWNF